MFPRLCAIIAVALVLGGLGHQFLETNAGTDTEGDETCALQARSSQTRGKTEAKAIPSPYGFPTVVNVVNVVGSMAAAAAAPGYQPKYPPIPHAGAQGYPPAYPPPPVTPDEGLKMAVGACLRANGTGVIEDAISSTALPVTIGFFNDLPYDVFWTGQQMHDGHLWAAPAKGSRIPYGQMFVLVAYARSDGLAGMVTLQDVHGNLLTVDFQSYRVRNFISGCDALRVRATRTPAHQAVSGDRPKLCGTSGYGIKKVDDYNVLVDLMDAQ